MAFSYIASPYTDDDPTIMQDRYEQVAIYTAHCLQGGDFVYSPIVHCHGIAVKHSLPKEIDFWQDYNRAMLSRAKELRVCMFNGWSQSKGIAYEISIANQLKIPVVHVNPASYI